MNGDTDRNPCTAVARLNVPITLKSTWLRRETKQLSKNVFAHREYQKVIDILQWEISRPCPLLPVCLVCYCIYGGPMLPVSLHRRQENESGVRILFPPLQPFLFRSFFLRLSSEKT